MKVTVNGAQHHFDKAMTVAGLINYLGLAERKVAVEMNLEIVPASRHQSTPLAEGDRIEIIEAVGGG